MPSAEPSGDHDVVIVGDGPAGAGLAAACDALGLDAVVIGSGAPWTATYGTWLDDVPDLPRAVFATTRDRVVVEGERAHRLDRSYGVLDNAALRAHLGLDDRLRPGTAIALAADAGRATVHLAGGGAVTAGVAVDATGAGSTLLGPVPREPAPAWQTALGVVVDEATVAGRFRTDAVTLMAWSRDPVPAPGSPPGNPVPSFCYVVPVANGWLVEETVLAARPAVPPAALRPALVARIGEDAVAAAEAAQRVEQVRIPVGLPIRAGHGRLVPFGAAAGYIHPASGFSVAAALRAAPRVAQMIAAGSPLADAVWPRPARRARVLHDYGLEVLLRLDPAAIQRFFDAFFALPTESWTRYLRVDTDATEVAAVMARVFAAVPWSVRRQLVVADPGVLVRLVRG